jgi:proline dehydrogenase
MNDHGLDFQDTAIAFSDKSDAELREKHRIFKLMSSPFVSGVGMKLATLALRVGIPVRPLIKKTVFKQFCGGETIEECQPTVEKLGQSGIGTILDYSVEGKSDEKIFESTKNEIYRTVTRAKEDPDIPFAVFKTTGIARFEILEKVSLGKELLKGEQAEWDRARARVEEICSHAHSLDQPLFIDAEESWIQDAIDLVAAEMMEKFNRERPLIFNTIQLYRVDRLDFLKRAHTASRERQYYLAVKLVRGAYMEKERERAEELGYASPIHVNKRATDDSFNAAVAYCIENIGNIAVCAGTHNDASVAEMAALMESAGLPPNDANIYFSQLYGMSDNLTYVLAKAKYNVSKYVPYGAVKDTVPYLIRRAEENSAVTGQVGRELELIERELKRRETASRKT